MNLEIEKFADYLIEWIVSKCDMEFDRQTEFNIVRMIVDCVELYEKESKKRMNKEFEKIIEKLEKEKMFYFLTIANTGDEKLDYAYEKVGNALDKAIEIVKQEAEQYEDGWIPCSEKLPELRKNVIVTVKYTGFMGMHGYWIKTGHMEAENDWWGDCAGGEVIAWQPLPEPFKERD